jgi:hypothetical protein
MRAVQNSCSIKLWTMLFRNDNIGLFVVNCNLIKLRYNLLIHVEESLS